MHVGAGLTAQSVAFVTNIDDDERISEAGIVYSSCCGSWFFCTPNRRIAIGASNTRREPLVLKPANEQSSAWIPRIFIIALNT